MASVLVIVPTYNERDNLPAIVTAVHEHLAAADLLIVDVHVRDLTGGFKCFRRHLLEALDLDSVSAQGYGFQIEMTWRAVKAGFRVEEVPIVFVDRRVGQSKMSKKIFVEALTLVWKLRLSGSGGVARSLA